MNKELIDTLERIANQIELERKEETNSDVKVGLRRSEWLLRVKIGEILKSEINNKLKTK